MEWVYESNGNEQEFYAFNRDARNKLGLLDNDLVSDRNIAIQECGIAEFNHIDLLRNAIQNGDIEQLDPNSNIPTKTYLPYGKISITALKEYVKVFKITLLDTVAEKNLPPEQKDAKEEDNSGPLNSTGSTKPVDQQFAQGVNIFSMQKNKLRLNTLDPAIDKAIKLANGSLELATVYLELKDLALDGEKPFTGEIDGDALFYTNDHNVSDKLTKNALGKKLARLRQKVNNGR